jgi:signal transduction histidine kinase
MNTKTKEEPFFTSEYIKHKWLCLSMSGIFMMWATLDFLSLDPYAPVFLTIRFFIFAVTFLFASNLNRKLFFNNHKRITTSILTAIAVSNTFFILLSPMPLVNASYQLVLYTALPTLFAVHPKHSMPIIMLPFLTYLTSITIIEESNAFTLIALVSVTTLTIILTISQYVSYTFLQSSLKNFIDLETSKKNVLELLDENNQLVRILCHDLGNSLTIIDLSSSLIESVHKKQGDIPPIISKNMLRVRRAITTQKEIIEHVQKKEALESGKFKIELVPVSVNVLIEKVKFIFQDQLQKKNITLSVNYGTEQSPYVAAEMVSLSNNVMNNVISNAIKFSQNDSEIIISSWTDKSDVYITIEDFGIGMSEDLLKNVFKSNVKTNRPGVNGEKGTGFGIPLAKSFMKKYGGDIYVESKENKGTRYTLKFQSIEQLEDTKLKLAS